MISNLMQHTQINMLLKLRLLLMNIFHLLYEKHIKFDVCATKIWLKDSTFVKCS